MRTYTQLISECREITGDILVKSPKNSFFNRQKKLITEAEKTKEKPNNWIMYYIDRSAPRMGGGAVVVYGFDKDEALRAFKKKKDLKNAPNGALLKLAAGPYDKEKLERELKNIHKSKLNEGYNSNYDNDYFSVRIDPADSSKLSSLLRKKMIKFNKNPDHGDDVFNVWTKLTKELEKQINNFRIVKITEFNT